MLTQAQSDSPVRGLTLTLATLILLLAAAFNALALAHAGRFHPDEAFYMTIARNAAIHGDWWLISEPLDKPPLTYYANALSLTLLALEADTAGVLHLDVYRGEFAGRMMAWWSSLVLVAALMALAKTLTRRHRAAWLAGLLLAVSPLRVAFAATAFTDMPMLLFAALALLWAARGRPAWAGVWFGLSLAAKPQSVFLLPVVVIFFLYRSGHLSPPHAGWSFRRSIMRFMLPVLSIGLLLLAWDGMRLAQGGASFWQLGQARYTPTTLTPLEDYPQRLATLWTTLQYALGCGWLTAGALAYSLWRTRHRGEGLRRWLWLWLAGFVGLHSGLTLNLFDRNLLVVLPVVALLVSPLDRTALYWRRDSLASLSSGKGAGVRLIGLGLLVLLLIPAWQASTGALPIGGDRGQHAGIDRLAQHLNRKPVATVIYDRWLDWELDYYLGEWTNKRRVFYPTPGALRAGALALDESGVRYWVAPADADHAAWLAPLREAGFGIWLDAHIAHFVVYALHPPHLGSPPSVESSAGLSGLRR